MVTGTCDAADAEAPGRCTLLRLTQRWISLTHASGRSPSSWAMAHTSRCVMRGSVSVQGCMGPSSGGSSSSSRRCPSNQSRTLLLRLATVHSRSTSAGKSSAAMGTWKVTWAMRWRATASRKKVQVRNRASSVSRCPPSPLHVASLSSHGSGRPISEVGVGRGPGSDTRLSALEEEEEAIRKVSNALLHAARCESLGGSVRACTTACGGSRPQQRSWCYHQANTRLMFTCCWCSSPLVLLRPSDREERCWRRRSSKALHENEWMRVRCCCGHQRVC